MGPDALVIEELGLRHGLARVDLAVVDGLLHGFEIKSGFDRLTRLPSQAKVFSEVLDRVTANDKGHVVIDTAVSRLQAIE